jgi:hypothetical protein
VLHTSEGVTSNAQSKVIQPLYIVKLQESVLTAFRAIPFCRFRFVLFLYKMVVTLFVFEGKRQLINIKKLAQAEKDIMGKSSIPCN